MYEVVNSKFVIKQHRDTPSNTCRSYDSNTVMKFFIKTMNFFRRSISTSLTRSEKEKKVKRQKLKMISNFSTYNVHYFNKTKNQFAARTQQNMEESDTKSGTSIRRR